MPRLSENLPTGAKLSFPTRAWRTTSPTSTVAHVVSYYVGHPHEPFALCANYLVLTTSGKGLRQCAACIKRLTLHDLWPL